MADHVFAEVRQSGHLEYVAGISQISKLVEVHPTVLLLVKMFLSFNTGTELRPPISVLNRSVGLKTVFQWDQAAAWICISHRHT